MSKQRRIISLFLFFVLLGLSIRAALPDIFGQIDSDCQEFGHIHYHAHAQTAHDQNQKSSEDNCHQGKSVLNYSTLPASIFLIPTKIFQLEFDLNFNHEIVISSPEPEPLRKPPKSYS